MTSSSVTTIFLNMEKIFEQDDSIVGVNGDIVADGANSKGFTFEEGLRLAEQYRRRKVAACHTRDHRQVCRWVQRDYSVSHR